MKKKHIGTLVVKFGTENFFGGDEHLDQGVFDHYARQIAELSNVGTRVVIVSSGSIKAGRERLSSLSISSDCFNKKEIAGIGNRHLLNKWGDSFSSYGKEIAQVWVTFANWQDDHERENIRTALDTYASHGIIPVVNENDVISDEEIRLMEEGISENDRLARMVAFLLKSDAVLFLTRVGGVYSGDPSQDKDARLYAEIDWREWRNDSSKIAGTSHNGSGGMRVKVHEATLCAQAGMRVAVAGGVPNVIEMFSSGCDVGTMIGLRDRFY
ncbi:MAG: hypothetical protein V1652_00500 [bacterium]